MASSSTELQADNRRPTAMDRRSLVRMLRFGADLRSSGYDVASTCNLRCEGCFYFSGEASNIQADTSVLSDWQAFFRAERGRGVNYAFLAGAEPSLYLDRIRAAAAEIPWGMVFTNGTRRIPADIPYRLHISLWGDDDTADRVRGASVNNKAFRNYAGDPRALFIYTINAQNIDEIAPMVARCATAGVPISFNYYSPTGDYLTRLAEQAGDRSDYFRFSTPDDNLLLDETAFARCRTVLKSVLETWPDTVLYSMDYDRWITASPAPYALDAEGIATDCSFRADGWHRHHQIDRSVSAQKCGNPNLDCSACRTYAAGMGSYVRQLRQSAGQDNARQAWAEAFSVWQNIFMGPQLSSQRRLAAE
ncbi:radical SAM protein [Maricaulis sp.]|uniref:radical SAM protein n=1 Tax=Maricaulis sp. TaxID=1486257 RepID=UPI0025C6A05B|nr:radical SAM protein [Maricaulis sp.]